LTSVFSSSLNLPLQFNMDGHVAWWSLFARMVVA
jgi:hypothetical protein